MLIGACNPMLSPIWGFRHVGAHLFEHCINGLLKDKTVVFATHQLQYLSRCDQVWFIDGGTVSTGNHAGLRDSLPAYASFVESTAQRKSTETGEPQPQQEGGANTPGTTATCAKAGSAAVPAAADDASKVCPEATAPMLPTLAPKLPKAKGVKWSTYGSYMRSLGGVPMALFLLLLFPLALGCKVFTDWWVGHWIKQGDGTDPAGDLQDNPDKHWYMMIMCFGGLSFIIFSAGRGYVLHWHAVPVPHMVPLPPHPPSAILATLHS